MGKKSPTPPPPVDYTGAAVQGARTTAALNRPDIYTPLGSQTWTEIGPDKYRQDVNLAPGTQAALESQQALEAARQKAAMGYFGGGSQFGQPFDFGDIDTTRIEDAIYGRHARYLDPQFEQGEERERNRLASQGFQVGNVGFDRALSNFARQKEQAYGGAREAAIIGGDQARQRAIQEALLKRQAPLQEMLALSGTGNVQLPQFQGTPGTNVDLLGAAQATGQQAQQTYAQQVAEQNAQRQLLGQTAMTAALLFGTGGLGLAGAGAAGTAGLSGGRLV